MFSKAITQPQHANLNRHADRYDEMVSSTAIHLAGRKSAAGGLYKRELRTA